MILRLESCDFCVKNLKSMFFTNLHGKIDFSSSFFCRPGRFWAKMGKINVHQDQKHLTNSRYARFECGRLNLSKFHFSIWFFNDHVDVGFTRWLRTTRSTSHGGQAVASTTKWPLSYAGSTYHGPEDLRFGAGTVPAPSRRPPVASASPPEASGRPPAWSQRRASAKSEDLRLDADAYRLFVRCFWTWYTFISPDLSSKATRPCPTDEKMKKKNQVFHCD